MLDVDEARVREPLGELRAWVGLAAQGGRGRAEGGDPLVEGVGRREGGIRGVVEEVEVLEFGVGAGAEVAVVV